MNDFRRLDDVVNEATEGECLYVANFDLGDSEQILAEIFDKLNSFYISNSKIHTLKRIANSTKRYSNDTVHLYKISVEHIESFDLS